jgi:SAM-dependent methyltransferase
MFQPIIVSFTSFKIATYTPQVQTISQTPSKQPELLVPKRRPDVGYVPTPQQVVDAMLELAEVTQNDIVYDLGSGDGRIPITAAKKYGIHSVGIEINPRLIKEANENAQKEGVSDRVQFLEQDLFQTNLSEATVVTLYLLPEVNLKLRPQLFKQLKPGTRVVSHTFDMGDWKPDKIVRTPQGSIIYLWVIPKEIPANL